MASGRLSHWENPTGSSDDEELVPWHYLEMAPRVGDGSTEQGMPSPQATSGGGRCARPLVPTWGFIGLATEVPTTPKAALPVLEQQASAGPGVSRMEAGRAQGSRALACVCCNRRWEVCAIQPWQANTIWPSRTYCPTGLHCPQQRTHPPAAHYPRVLPSPAPRPPVTPSNTLEHLDLTKCTDVGTNLPTGSRVCTPMPPGCGP